MRGHAPRLSMMSRCSPIYASKGWLEGWHDLSILGSPSYPPYFHLICALHLICSFPSRISHLVDLIYSIRRHLESRAFRICHLVNLVHLIYLIQPHLDLGWASRPSHLPSCHLEMKIEILVFTSSSDRASPQGWLARQSTGVADMSVASIR